MIQAFQVPLENILPHGTKIVKSLRSGADQLRVIAGFVTLWALNYLTIIAGGFAMETILALLGVTWLPFFLIMWIIRTSYATTVLWLTSNAFPVNISRSSSCELERRVGSSSCSFVILPYRSDAVLLQAVILHAIRT